MGVPLRLGVRDTRGTGQEEAPTEESARARNRSDLQRRPQHTTPQRRIRRPKPRALRSASQTSPSQPAARKSRAAEYQRLLQRDRAFSNQGTRASRARRRYEEISAPTMRAAQASERTTRPTFAAP